MWLPGTWLYICLKFIVSAFSVPSSCSRSLWWCCWWMWWRSWVRNVLLKRSKFLDTLAHLLPSLLPLLLLALAELTLLHLLPTSLLPSQASPLCLPTFPALVALLVDLMLPLPLSHLFLHQHSPLPLPQHLPSLLLLLLLSLLSPLLATRLLLLLHSLLSPLSTFPP